MLGVVDANVVSERGRLEDLRTVRTLQPLHAQRRVLVFHVVAQLALVLEMHVALVALEFGDNNRMRALVVGIEALFRAVEGLARVALEQLFKLNDYEIRKKKDNIEKIYSSEMI